MLTFHFFQISKITLYLKIRIIVLKCEGKMLLKQIGFKTSLFYKLQINQVPQINSFGLNYNQIWFVKNQNVKMITPSHCKTTNISGLLETPRATARLQIYQVDVRKLERYLMDNSRVTLYRKTRVPSLIGSQRGMVVEHNTTRLSSRHCREVY